MRLAAALGTALKRGARVVASRDSPAACRMIKRAMISGLNSTGVDVADLRVSPPAVSRHVLKTQAFDAALPRRHEPARPRGRPDPLLRAAGHPAHAVAPEGDREALHAPGAPARRRGRASARSRTRRACARATRRTCSIGSTARRSAARGFRIVVDYGYSAASFVLPLVVGPLGVEAVSAHGFFADGARPRAGSRRRSATRSGS